jgi:hypothetical protein
MHKLFLKLTVWIFFIFSFNNLYSKKDTLYIYARGYFDKNQKFIIKYNNTQVGYFGFDKSQIKFKILIDSGSIQEFNGINLQILESKKNKDWVHLKYKFIYYPKYNHILIYYMPFSDNQKSFEIFYLPYFIEQFIFD